MSYDGRSYANAIASSDVDEGVFKQSSEDEDEADDHPDVDCLNVGHPRQLRVDP